MWSETWLLMRDRQASSEASARVWSSQPTESSKCTATRTLTDGWATEPVRKWQKTTFWSPFSQEVSQKAWLHSSSCPSMSCDCGFRWSNTRRSRSTSWVWKWKVTKRKLWSIMEWSMWRGKSIETRAWRPFTRVSPPTCWKYSHRLAYFSFHTRLPCCSCSLLRQRGRRVQLGSRKQTDLLDW